MRIAIVCICFNTYAHLRRFADSLRTAQAAAPDVVLQLVVVDHSTDPVDEAAIAAVREAVPGMVHLRSPNVGYFPGFARGVATLDVDAYDYIAISNVDLEVDPGFLAAMRGLPRRDEDRWGVIAPAIVSRLHGADLNPFYLRRRRRIYYLWSLWIFQRPRLLRIYRWFSDLRARRRIPMPAGTLCFAPHGSFMLFTSHYFARGGRVDFPCFLLAEEEFVGEECRRIGLSVSYQPTAKITHAAHASTGRLSQAFLTRQHVQSVRYIIDTYYHAG